MTDSEGDTIPFTPDSIAENIANPVLDGIFAWLRPHSPTAQAAFDAIVNAGITYTEKYRDTRQFLHLDDHRKKRALSIHTEDGETEVSGSLQWSGAFKLSLNVLPRDPVKGWYLGSSSEEADLVLVPSSKGWLQRTRIAGRHARLFLHPESNRVVLEARHTVTTSKTGVQVLHGSACRVLEHGELVAINDCCYTFEFTDLFATQGFDEGLSVFMKHYHGSQWFMNKLLSPNSVGKPLLLGEYFCSPSAFAQGTFGKVSAGWTQNGAAVAIKVFKSPRESEVRSHEQLMKYIGTHTNVVQLLDCVYHFDTDVPDAYSVYAPLAVTDLTHLLDEYQFDSNAKLTLFIDYLNGLAYLNDKLQIMHRDINPNNLAVTSFDSPRGVILDLDAATTVQFSTDHTKGTVPYLAPEIIRLKEPRPRAQQPAYGKSVDVWAMGLSGFALFRAQRFRWQHFVPRGGKISSSVTAELHAEFHRKLVSSDDQEAAVLSLIMLMTSYDSSERPSSTHALASAQIIRKDKEGRGKIVRKAPAKRRRED